MTFLRRLSGGLLLLASLSCGIVDAQAHELRPAVADISRSSTTLQIAIRSNLEALISEIGAEHEDSDDAPQRSRYQQLRSLPPEALENELRQYLPTLLQGIVLSPASDPDLSLPLSLASVDIPPTGDPSLARDSMLVLETPVTEALEAITWRWDERYGTLILRADTPQDPHNAELASSRIALDAEETSSSSIGIDTDTDTDTAPEASAQPFTQYLQPGERSDPISMTADVAQTGGSGFIDYVIIGFEHIIPKGLDHILFVIGLFLLAPRLKPIVWQVSMFTVAHTVTLALGITGIIVLPASIVEPLIALSITIVCVENLLGSHFGPTRLAMVFAFGLLHGLGFAGVLSDIGLADGRFVSSLLAFNIGVELGQLSVVLLCFAVVGWWFGDKPWYRRRISIPASLVIGAIGLYWFLQRIELVG